MDIKARLLSMQDTKYRDFSLSLIPNISCESVIGVRIPQLRALSAELVKSGEYTDFIKDLPHNYFEEYHLHSFVISQMKDFDSCIAELEKFLPHVDNWSVCDSLRPKCFAKNRHKLLPNIEQWLKSEHTYTKRFAIEMLMVHYLDEDFSPQYLKSVAELETDEYYLKMMIAWYFATALAKQCNCALPYISERKIKDRWIHNKIIQKACESYRIDAETKTKLKKMKI